MFKKISVLLFIAFIPLYGFSLNNYEHKLAYPKTAKLNEINEITLTISNTSNIDDQRLTLAIVCIDPAFKILGAEPKSANLDSAMGSTYLDYETGIKSGQTKIYKIYFKISNPDKYTSIYQIKPHGEITYNGKVSFYTDKHGFDECEKVSNFTINCLW